MAEGFGRWESDPLFPAAECVQDSADRMEGVYRLLLHEKKVIQDDTSDAKLHGPIHHERDVITALGTTKWQLEQFEREVNAAAFSNKSNSRENAILKFRQFIRAIAEQISEVEESLKNLRSDFSRTPKYPYSSEQDGDGLASFLSGSKDDGRAYYSTGTDEITELKSDSAPMVNGYHSSQEHTSGEFRYSGNDVEGASKLQCSCGEDHTDNSLCSLDDDSVGRSHRYKNTLSRQYRSFMRNLWFTKRGRESFTKRRKDGEVMNGLRNGNILPSFNLRTSGRARYCWPELIKRRLSRSDYNHSQVCIATSMLVALALIDIWFMLAGFACQVTATDQCRATEVAIGNVLPGTKHRWCKWHVLRKAKERLGALYGKNSQFKVDFHRIVNQMLTKEEFEGAWMHMLSMYALEKNPYLYQIYETRDKWAKPYFSGIFYVRTTSTQRSESANHMLKTYVPPGSAMHVFVKQFNQLLYDRDAEESFQEKRTRLGGVVYKVGEPMEKHAAKIYTRTMLEKFQEVLYKSGSYYVDELVPGKVYVAKHFDSESREKWCKVEYKVLVGNGYYTCECGPGPPQVHGDSSPACDEEMDSRRARCPLDITPEYRTKVKVAYTLLALSYFVALRHANLTISEEALYIVLNPERIGEYDFASYALQVLRESAHMSRKDQAEGSMTILAGGCWALLEVFSFDWLVIPELDATRYLSPRIAAYSSHYLRELVKGETYDTGEGKIYGKARTRPLGRAVSPRYGEGSSAQGASQMRQADRSLSSPSRAAPTLEEFVAMVLADQTTRVSDMFEHVCHQYRMIDKQVEADRKRRRNEVNIAAGALDSELGRKLAKKYTDIVAKILEGSGVLHYYPWVVKLLQQAPVRVGSATTCTPIVGFSPTGVRNGTSIVDESRPAQAEASTPGIHGDGGINTIARAAEILRSMSSDKVKGKEPLIEDDSARGSKLAIHWSTPVVSSRGLVIDEPISVSSGRASGRMPVWDAPLLPGEMELDMMYASDGMEKEFQYSLHPSILGLSHVPYPSHFVDSFYDSFSYLTDEDDLKKKYYISLDREEFGWSIILTGQDVKSQMEGETEINYHTMAASNRDTNLRDRTMYCNEEYPYGALVEPDWATLLQIHFLYDPAGTSVAYIGQLMSATRIGYDISKSCMIMATVRLLDSWSLYGFDLLDKIIHVLDPLYQGATDAAFVSKHSDSTKCLLTGLRRCGERHGYGWNVVESEWRVHYHSSMHPRCSHENTGVYMFLYATDFNGETVPNLQDGLSHRQVSHLRRKMLYQITASRANSGEVPGYLVHNNW
ncbi:hypothetical protein ACQ4PT_048439 [Festuca glaucescens]